MEGMISKEDGKYVFDSKQTLTVLYHNNMSKQNTTKMQHNNSLHIRGNKSKLK